MFSLHFDLACKTGWDEDTTSNKCLKAFTGDANKMTWQNAQRKCEEQGLNGNLASLGSQDIVLRKFKSIVCKCIISNWLLRSKWCIIKNLINAFNINRFGTGTARADSRPDTTTVEYDVKPILEKKKLVASVGEW